MNFNSPYQVMLKGLLSKNYIKVDIEMINMRIDAYEDILRYAKTNERRKLCIKLIKRQEQNRDFVSQQLNQQMLEEAQDGYIKF